MIPEIIQKRIVAVSNSSHAKDYVTIAKTINQKLGYTLFDTQHHLKSQFDVLARLIERN